MNSKLLSLLAGVAVISFAASASAKDLKPLSDTQLDRVAAGTSSTVAIIGAAAGDILASVGGSAATAVSGLNAAAAASVVSVASSFTPGPGAAAVSEIGALLTSP